MADSSVAITAGAGTAIDTRTEGTNGNHRQVVVIGDPATNAGVCPVDATAGMKVDLGADNDIQGAVAHDAAVSGNPVLNGAEARDTQGTAVASGDAVRLAADKYGRLLVTSMPPSHASSNGTPITATTTSVIAAPGASTHLRIVRIHLSNGGATPCWVAIRDGAAGTRHYNTYLVQGAAVSLNLATSGPLDLTTVTRLDIFMSAAGSVEYEIDYFTVAD